MNLKLSIIFTFVFVALAQDTTSCTDDLLCSACQCTGNISAVARGDIVTLCAHYVTVNKTTGCIIAQRAAFPVKVDTFSSIQVNGSQATFQPFGYVNIVAQVGSVSSYPLTYLQNEQFYSNKFSFVVQLSQGVIQSIIWDHQCATCSSSDCYKFAMPNGTLIDTICNDQSCITSASGACDPQIYITWVGSDVNGNKMTSAGMRLSRFDQFSLSDLLDAKTIPAYVIPNNTNTTPDTTNTGTTPSTDTTPSTTPVNTL